MPDYVYVLTNAAMPGIVKVGKTSNIPQRIRTLSSHSGVPVPFDLELAIEVKDAARLEGALHGTLQGSRVNPKREFFEIDVEDLRIVLTECGEDVTASLDPRQVTTPVGTVPEIDRDETRPIDDEDFEASTQLRRKRPIFSFDELGIDKGSRLTCTRHEPDAEPERSHVVGPRHVKFRNERMSLTRATRLALRRDYDVPPLPYWQTDDERLLQDVYDDFHRHRT